MNFEHKGQWLKQFNENSFIKGLEDKIAKSEKKIAQLEKQKKDKIELERQKYAKLKMPFDAEENSLIKHYDNLIQQEQKDLTKNRDLLDKYKKRLK